MALMELGRWNEAAQRLVEALDRDPEDIPLSGLAERLIVEHPQPGDLRAWLSQELSKPEHHDAAGVILPMLGS